MNVMQTAIEYLKGVGPERARLLKTELQIHTYQDLLHFFPNRYIDRTQFHSLGKLSQNNSEIQLKGVITSIEYVEQKRGKRMVATFSDDTGSIELVWFRGHKWIRESLKLHTPYVIFGRLNWFKGKASMPHPEMELKEHYEQGVKAAFYPIYPTTEKLTQKGVSQRVIQKLVAFLLQEHAASFAETLPEYLLDHYRFCSKKEALWHIHFPTNQHKLTRAQQRLKFEEFFFLQVQLLLKNQQRKQKIKGHTFKTVGPVFREFYEQHLPFSLTKAQKKVIKEIRNDMGSGRQMNRLLQGDVGSGKTIVALFASLLAIDNQFQGCIVAPTEILAQQHYQTLTELLSKTEVRCELLTGSSSKKERVFIHEGLQNGTLHLLVGTHAIFEETVQFKNLGLAVIDEQHRFGVAQRAKLWHKNAVPPHVLVMTATPIPRTLAMSIYGDLDYSVIDELPPGRKPVKTLHRFDQNRLKVFAFIKEQIDLGRQVYIVYPLIQESEKLDYKDLMDGYESISRSFPTPQYQISILHGQMKADDKAYEMDRFVRGETNIMVATTVIEVGVNVPNASVMIVESAERFGLSQLHQLRGRVGRGADQSYCILMSSHALSDDGKIRLETMVKTNDGFEIAEVDLRLRGPGNVMGTQQSGILQLKIADLAKDVTLLKAARNSAKQMLKNDPELINSHHQCVKRTLSSMRLDANIWNFIS